MLDTLQTKKPLVTTKTLLVEGWRGVGHSIALVNQYQLLELLKLQGLKLYHHDLPYALNWTRSQTGSGLDLANCTAIENLPPLPNDVAVDCVYRICAPIRAGDPADQRRTITFMISEMGLGPGSFADGAGTSPFFTRDENLIVTASEWSRQRLLDYGYPPEKVKIVPLGVDTETFTPLPAAERTLLRAQWGFHPDETVFVNVGGAFWNKGVDLLLRAFLVLRARGRQVRLVLKDQRDVYGVSVERTLLNVGADCPELLQPETLAAITAIPDKLERNQLRALFGIADAYVSPYRAEGFNLPVLEALACGTPLIVTQGGATDDFCNDDLARRIPGRDSVLIDPSTGDKNRYIEPDLDALITAMDELARGKHVALERYAAAREEMLANFTWTKAAAQLATLTVGLDAPLSPTPAFAIPAPRPVQQQEVLSLLGMIRPLTMASGTKVRVGNTYDGGYVMPDRALGCDAVLSIGVGHDVSFDLALAERGAMVVQFDHTVEALPSAHPNFRFHKLGWGVRTEGDLLSFKDMRTAFGAVPAHHPMLKFDVEGAEYDTIAAMTAADLQEFEVITCELHDFAKLGDRSMFERIHSTLEKLTFHHAPIHLHANNYRGLTLIAGVPVPDVLELTLLRRDLDVFPGPSTEPIPGPLDRPNNPGLSDLCLRVF